MTPKSFPLYRPWLWLLPPAVLLMHAFFYYPFFMDDNFISLRYAERLVEGKGLNWNDGENVEGYSNLLWVLLMAGFKAIGFDLVGASRAMSLLGALAGMAALARFCLHHCVGEYRQRVTFWTCITYALSAPVAVWGIGGMETSWVMALFAWAFVLASEMLDAPNNRLSTIAGICLGLICWLRPEGPLFTLTCAGALLLMARYPLMQRVRVLVPLCMIPFAFFMAQLGFRLAYYGTWFANTVHAKVAFTSIRVWVGFMYVLFALTSQIPVVLMVFMQWGDARRKKTHADIRRLACFMLIPACVWMLIVSSAGGDFFPGFRQALSILFFLIALCGLSLHLGFESLGTKKMQYLHLYVLACLVWFQGTFQEIASARGPQWEQRGTELALYLKRAYENEQPLIAVGPAGIFPYYTGFPSVDMHGLNDAYLTANPPENFGYGRLGHDLLDPKYLMSRKPDIMIFHIGNASPDDYGMQETPAFYTDYSPQTISLPSYDATIWVRNDSPIGKRQASQQ